MIVVGILFKCRDRNMLETKRVGKFEFLTGDGARRLSVAHFNLFSTLQPDMGLQLHLAEQQVPQKSSLPTSADHQFISNSRA